MVQVESSLIVVKVESSLVLVQVESSLVVMQEENELQEQMLLQLKRQTLMV